MNSPLLSTGTSMSTTFLLVKVSGCCDGGLVDAHRHIRVHSQIQHLVKVSDDLLSRLGRDIGARYHGTQSSVRHTEISYLAARSYEVFSGFYIPRGAPGSLQSSCPPSRINLYAILTYTFCPVLVPILDTC